MMKGLLEKFQSEANVLQGHVYEQYVMFGQLGLKTHP